MTGLAISIVGALVAALICAEVKAWCPKLVATILRYAVRLAPAQLRTRLEEEWSAHLEEMPGSVGRVLAAIGFVFAASQLASRVSLSDRLAMVRVVLIAPWNYIVLSLSHENLRKGPFGARLLYALSIPRGMVLVTRLVWLFATPVWLGKIDLETTSLVVDSVMEKLIRKLREREQNRGQ